jgi:hypothetical protein
MVSIPDKDKTSLTQRAIALEETGLNGLIKDKKRRFA